MLNAINSKLKKKRELDLLCGIVGKELVFN